MTQIVKFNVGDEVEVIFDGFLKGRTVKPPIKVGEIHNIYDIVLDKEGNQHLDLGIESKYNYITSFETDEELPNGENVHYVHPSRVAKITPIITD